MNISSSFKSILLIILLMMALISLSGCRIRTSGETSNNIPFSESSENSGSSSHADAESSESGESAIPDSSLSRDSDQIESPDFTHENPEADRKEYDALADVEIVQGTDRNIAEQANGSAAALITDESENSVHILSPDAELTATLRIPAEEADRMAVSEEADAADSAMTYYTVLLQDRLSSLFECKRLNVYWESADDFVTIYKTSPEHRLILDSGCYDVSSRLTEERLHVDAGWVSRKNPDVIVKVVPPAVLGSEIYSTASSQAIRQSLYAREEWTGISAIRDNRVIILSSDMLDAVHLKLLAELTIAKTAYPEQFQDLDLNEAFSMLSEEATGILSEAVYFDLGT